MNTMHASRTESTPARRNPRGEEELSIQEYLEANRRLYITRDPATGRLLSSDGRKADPNQALADSLSENYEVTEPLLGLIRKASSEPDGKGYIGFSAVNLPFSGLMDYLIDLQRAGILHSYRLGSSHIDIQVNTQARDFLTKGFAQLHVMNHIKQEEKPEDLFYNVPICLEPNGKTRFTVDVIRRDEDEVTYTLIALSPHLEQSPQQIERLVRIVDYLKDDVQIIVSPRVNRRAVEDKINSLTKRWTGAVKIYPYTHLDYLYDRDAYLLDVHPDLYDDWEELMQS